MSLRERSIMILDALSTEHGPETFVSDGYAYYEDALGALIAFAREIRNEALEEAQQQYLDYDYDMAYARVCILVHGGDPDKDVASSEKKL